MISQKIGCLLVGLICCKLSLSQYFTHGPILGGTTDTSVNIYLRPIGKQKIAIKLKNTSTESILYFKENATRNIDNSTILKLEGLQPATLYHYELFYGELKDSIQDNFTTFPETGKKGNYSFVTGSCQETDNMKVFDAIRKHNPAFFIHTGDFTYPTKLFGTDYSKEYRKVAESYQKKYEEKTMRELLHNIPIDYVYDDNDYIGNNASRYNLNQIATSKKNNFRDKEIEFKKVDLPPSWRTNVIKGYIDFFPGYNLIDTSEGLYHSFKYGNVEFFFLDRSSARKTPISSSFTLGKFDRRWKFTPSPEACLFCEKQMNWLKSAIKNSTADWKFIISGVPLNKKMIELIKAAQHFQKIKFKNYSGSKLMATTSSFWAAFPYEQEDFYNFLKEEGLKNIIVLSGDIHHSVIDNGENAGLPELTASGLSVSSSKFGYYFNLFGKITAHYNYKRKIWNQGGNGVGNKNYKNTFGKVTIVNNQYVQLSIIDEDNNIISKYNVPFEE